MAGIETYLEQIKNAIYGREVRQAIHDGIEQCYKDGKAGAVDLVARQEIAELIAPSGEAPSAAEVTDARIGADGTTYTSLGDAIRDQVSDLKSDLDDSGIAESVSYETLTGCIRASDGAVIGDLPNAHSSDIQLYTGDKLIVTAYTYAQFAILAEVVDGTYTSIITATTNGMKTTEYTAERDIVVSFSIMTNRNHNAKIIRNLATTQEMLRVGLEDKVGFIVDDLRNGTIENPTNTDAVTMINIRPTNGAYGARIFINRTPDEGTKYIARYTTFTIDNGNARSNMSYQKKYNYGSDKGTSFVDVLFDSDDKGFSFFLLQSKDVGGWEPLRITDFSANDIFIIYLYKGSSRFINYAMGSDFVKKPITLDYLGTLSAWQAFCIYDGYYYSTTNNGYLAKQDSNFNAVRTAQVEMGHGNSIQLGNKGKAYVSGWDDDTVYVVDLASMSLDSTISLPVSGYTTCVVDDINKLMYIFQRESHPSTEENYNFIVYDYDNENIISSKKLNVAFGAMQGCDFIDGKIFVLNGMGTNALPNGYRIYNTNGDVIGEYVIGTYSTLEPEGVFVNRETKEIYISYGNGKVYRVN